MNVKTFGKRNFLKIEIGIKNDGLDNECGWKKAKKIIKKIYLQFTEVKKHLFLFCNVASFALLLLLITNFNQP